MTLVLQYNWSQQIVSPAGGLKPLESTHCTDSFSLLSPLLSPLLTCPLFCQCRVQSGQQCLWLTIRNKPGCLEDIWGHPFPHLTITVQHGEVFPILGFFFQVSHPSNILVISHTSHIANEICIGKLWWGGVWEVCFPLTLIDQRRGLVCWEEGCPSQPKSDFRSFLASSRRFAGRCHATPPSHKPASK